jgi:hypothetical protein
MNRHGRSGLVRSTSALVLTAALAGCSGSTATPSPAGIASVAPSSAPPASVVPTVPSSPTPELTPAVPPSPTVPPPSAFTTAIPPSDDAGWTSLTFAKLAPDSPLATIRSMPRIPGGFLAVGTNIRDDASGTVSTPVWHSVDGATWTPLDPATFGASTVVLRAGTTPSGPVLVTVGATIGECQPSDDASCYSAVAPVQAWTSSDGVTWTASPVQGIDLQASDGNVDPPRVAIGPGGVVVYQPVKSGTQLVLSKDGIAWQSSSEAIPKTAALSDLEPFDTGFVAVGADPDGEDGHAVAFDSADGMTWREHKLPIPAQERFGTVAGRALVGANGILAQGSESAVPGADLSWSFNDRDGWTYLENDAPLGVWHGEGEGTGLIEDGSKVADGDRLVALRRDGGVGGWTSFNGYEWFPLEVTGLRPTAKGSWPIMGLTLLPVGVLYTDDDGATWLGTPSDL